MKHAYTVTIRLPAQKLQVMAHSPEDAKFQAWLMIGKAGVERHGTLTAERTAEAAA